MTERAGSVVEGGVLQRLETVRRPLSWLCITVFIGSFLGLLVLSATSRWSPANPWIMLLDRAWRISGILELALWVLPRLVGAGDWVSRLFSGGDD